MFQPQYTALLEQADALAIKAHPDMRTVIEAEKADVISRWDDLQKNNEEKKQTLHVSSLSFFPFSTDKINKLRKHFDENDKTYFNLCPCYSRT